jgi:hypothetical protein
MKCSQVLPLALISALLFLSPVFGQIELPDPEFASESFTCHPPVFVDPVEMAVAGRVQTNDAAAWVGRWNECAAGEGYYEEEPYYAYDYSYEYEYGVVQPLPELEVTQAAEEEVVVEDPVFVDYEYSYQSYLEAYGVGVVDPPVVRPQVVLKSVVLALAKSAVEDVAIEQEVDVPVDSYSLDYAYEEDAYYYGDYEYEYADSYVAETRPINTPSLADLEPAAPVVEDERVENESEVFGDERAFDKDYKWMNAPSVVEHKPWMPTIAPLAIRLAQEANNAIYAHSPIAWSIRSVRQFDRVYGWSDSRDTLRRALRRISRVEVATTATPIVEPMDRRQAFEDLMMDVSEVSGAENVEVRDYDVPESLLENRAEDSVYEFDAAWYPSID